MDLLRNYLNWNPKLAAGLVERNKDALFSMRKLYTDLFVLNEFLAEFPQINITIAVR
jgi:hypothetical protein